MVAYDPLPPKQYSIIDLSLLRHPGVIVHRYGVKGDGNCFFNALSAALSPQYIRSPLAEQVKMGQKLRRYIYHKLTDSRWRRMNFVNGMSAQQARTLLYTSTNWVTEPIFDFVAAVTRKNFIFIDLETDQVYIESIRNVATNPTFIFVWVKRKHFEPLLFDGSFAAPKAVLCRLRRMGIQAF